MDGTRLAVGAPVGYGQTVADRDAVYLFSFTDAAFSGGVLEATLGEGYVGGKNLDLAAQLDDIDQFGTSVSLDGTRLAVGAAGDDGQGNVGNANGAVYLFGFTDAAFSGGVLEAWLGEGYVGGKNLDLAAELDTGDTFGISVSLDEARLAVGSFGDDGQGNGGNFNGAVHLFSFTDKAFSGGVLEATLGAGYVGGKNLNLADQLDDRDFFGRSVSLEGTRLAVGAPFDAGEGNSGTTSGAVYLFSFTDAAFSGGALVARLGEGYVGGTNLDLAAPLDGGDRFGTSVSLDGTRLAVGADGDNGRGNGGSNNGAVYLFSFTDTVFSGGVLEAMLGASYVGGKNLDLAARLENLDQIGYSVSLDGTRLAVGAPFEDSQANVGINSNYGAVYLFSFTDTAFSGGVLEATLGEGYVGGKNLDLAAQLERSNLFGSAVSLDGTRLAVGASGDHGLGGDVPPNVEKCEIGIV